MMYDIDTLTEFLLNTVDNNDSKIYNVSKHSLTYIQSIRILDNCQYVFKGDQQ